MEFIILVAVFFGILIIISMRPKSPKNDNQQETSYHVTETITTKQFMETIDLMRDKNIITVQQHIDYMVKMNPYLK
jgi:hypothetical protein